MKKDEETVDSVKDLLKSSTVTKALKDMRTLEFSITAEELEGRAKNVDAKVIIHFKDDGTTH